MRGEGMARRGGFGTVIGVLRAIDRAGKAAERDRVRRQKAAERAENAYQRALAKRTQRSSTSFTVWCQAAGPGWPWTSKTNRSRCFWFRKGKTPGRTRGNQAWKRRGKAKGVGGESASSSQGLSRTKARIQQEKARIQQEKEDLAAALEDADEEFKERCEERRELRLHYVRSTLV